MHYIPELLSPKYFYVVRDAQGQHVDCGFVPLVRAQALVDQAIKVGLTVDLIEPNNTCH